MKSGRYRRRSVMTFAGALLAVIAAGLALAAAFVPHEGEAAGLRASLAAAFISVAVFALLTSHYEKRAEKDGSGETDFHRNAGGSPGDRRRSGADREGSSSGIAGEADGTPRVAEGTGDIARRLERLTEAYGDLLSHHRLTKQMLRSNRVDELFGVFLSGVRDGFGFSAALLGIRAPDGMLVFRDIKEAGNGQMVAIPCWDGRSLLARTLWRGERTLIRSVGLEGNAAEDRLVVGEGPAMLLPILRKNVISGTEYAEGRDAPCPAFEREGQRCWTVREEPGGPESQESRRECAVCDRFSPRALLVIRDGPGSRSVLPEAMGAVVSLASEAALALEVVSLYEEARRMSVTDGLTGLVNYREFYQCVRRELERAKRYRRTVSLLMIDLDDFKRFNDRFGHLAGDKALRQVADLLRRNARASDIVARYGGEEFGIIMPESTPSGALMLAERIKTEIAGTDFMPCVPGGVQITVSVGIYSTEDGTVTEDQFVNFADEAAYLAKNAGKNRVVVKTHA